MHKGAKLVENACFLGERYVFVRSVVFITILAKVSLVAREILFTQSYVHNITVEVSVYVKQRGCSKLLFINLFDVVKWKLNYVKLCE